MSRGTAHRTIRIEDGLWMPAKAKAEEDGVNLSEVIRGALRAYIQGVVEPLPAPPWKDAGRE